VGSWRGLVSKAINHGVHGVHSGKAKRLIFRWPTGFALWHVRRARRGENFSIRLPAKLHRFSDMGGADVLGPGQIGDGARYFLDSMKGACRQAKARGCLFQQGSTSGVRLAVQINFLGAEASVGFALALQLHGHGDTDALAYAG
jgi:hypothetical protein